MLARGDAAEGLADTGGLITLQCIDDDICLAGIVAELLVDPGYECGVEDDIGVVDAGWSAETPILFTSCSGMI